MLAIDCGTTGVRAVLHDERGRVTASAYRELTMLYPRPGWAEQDAARLWERTREVIGSVLAETGGAGAGKIAAIAVTNQRASVVGWDAATLAPVAPLIGWQDVRTVERCRELGAQGLFVTPNMSVTKAEWIVRNCEEARAARRRGTLRLGTADSWLCAKLTGGAHVTDHSNASATGFYQHFERGWDTATLAAVDLDETLLPALVDSSGVVDRAESDAIGLDAPVAALCGDQQGSLFGLGCHTAGATKCSYGTSAMVDANTGDSVTIGGPGTYPLVAWSIDGEVVYCVEGKVVTAGAAVQWLRDGLGVIDSAADTAELAASVADSAGVWIVPAFQGLGTPQDQSDARAMIGGLTRAATKAHLARAFLEGIAHRVADAAESVWQACARPSVLRVDGGASENGILLQLQADVLGITVERSATRDGAAAGAAMLAARAVELGDGSLGGGWRPDATFEPRIGADERAALRAAWQRRVEMVASALD